MSDLTMANVEALASEEMIAGLQYCAGSVYYYNPDTHMLFDGII